MAILRRATTALVLLVSSAYAATTYYNVTDTSALCLDGSIYGYFLCKGKSNASWTISIQGGGWCYSELDCLSRSTGALGSSKTWPSAAAGMGCDTGGDGNTVQMYYGDGASFTGYREAAWPVPGSGGRSIYFRGARNLDATLTDLLALHGMDQVKSLVLTGGSAGGLSTFLHLDHVADRVHAISPTAEVVGKPDCGFFIDHGNDGFDKPNVTYTLQMQYVYNMQNSSGSLSPACLQALAPDSWKCIMAPYAAPFIQQRWFALQSRFDHWQLSEELMLPCMRAQSYAPPYKPSTCTPAEKAAIEGYGPDFMKQFLPLVTGSRNGAFLDACIIHGSTNSSINGKNNNQAFDAWLAGTGPQWYIMQCNGSNSTGPCDPSPICAPY